MRIFRGHRMCSVRLGQVCRGESIIRTFEVVVTDSLSVQTSTGVCMHMCLTVGGANDFRPSKGESSSNCTGMFVRVRSWTWSIFSIRLLCASAPLSAASSFRSVCFWYAFLPPSHRFPAVSLPSSFSRVFNPSSENSLLLCYPMSSSRLSLRPSATLYVFVLSAPLFFVCVLASLLFFLYSHHRKHWNRRIRCDHTYCKVHD